MMVLSNSKAASLSMCLERMSEPERVGDSGVYLGRTAIYKIPFLLDFKLMVNPHMAIVGMSGAGKTYLLKALVARAVLHLEHNALILDWNGEYAKLVEYLEGREFIISSGTMLKLAVEELKRSLRSTDGRPIDESGLLAGVVSLNLSAIRQDSQKAEIVKALLAMVVSLMHGKGIANRRHHMIVLDEAWRLISESDELGVLFREGRKYGIGMVLATQMVGDIKNEVIANSATLVLFKLQNNDDFDTLAASGVIARNELDAIGSLGLGSCMINLSFKEAENGHRRVLIEKIEGIELDFYKIKSGKMRISAKKFREKTDGLQIGNDAKAKIFNFADLSDRSIDETRFISLLIGIGLDRPAIVAYLRDLGLDDISIVNSYEKANGK